MREALFYKGLRGIYITDFYIQYHVGNSVTKYNILLKKGKVGEVSCGDGESD